MTRSGNVLAWLAKRSLVYCLSRRQMFGRPVLLTLGATRWQKCAQSWCSEEAPFLIVPPYVNDGYRDDADSLDALWKLTQPRIDRALAEEYA